MRALLRALRPTFLIPMLLAFLVSPPLAFAGGPYYDSNGNNVYAAPQLMYGPTQGYPSGTVPHFICDSGCGSGGSIPAGTNLIGKVGIDQTAPDTTNAVSSKPTVAGFVQGTASQTSTTSTQLIAAVSSKSIYVTSFNCANSGSSDSIISFQDGSGGTVLNVTINKTIGGTNMPAGPIPLFKTTAGNGVFFAPGTASTTQYCSAAGFAQ